MSFMLRWRWQIRPSSDVDLFVVRLDHFFLVVNPALRYSFLGGDGSEEKKHRQRYEFLGLVVRCRVPVQVAICGGAMSSFGP